MKTRNEPKRKRKKKKRKKMATLKTKILRKEKIENINEIN